MGTRSEMERAGLELVPVWDADTTERGLIYYATALTQLWELALWCSGLSCHLQCWHLTWTMVHVPAVLLMIQLPVNAPGRALEDEPSALACASTWETWMKLSPSTWPHPGLYGH